MSEIELHRKLLGDAPRNAAFHAALKAAITPGRTTVADLGAGTGFLSLLARQLGATHCTLVDYTDTLDLAVRLARDNGVDGLAFLKGHSAEIRKPPKCDVVVSETLGNYALEEGMLETLNDARRWLKKGGVLIPAALAQFVAPVTHPRWQDEVDVWGRVGYGVQLDAARTTSLNNMFVRRITRDDLGGSTAQARCWQRLTFDPTAAPLPSLHRESLHWSVKNLGSATVYGWALWWEATLVPGVTLSTAPDAPPTHWDQVYLPLLNPVTLAAGEALELTLTHDSRPETGLNVGWRTRHLREGRALSAQDQDIARGRI